MRSKACPAAEIVKIRKRRNADVRETIPDLLDASLLKLQYRAAKAKRSAGAQRTKNLGEEKRLLALGKVFHEVFGERYGEVVVRERMTPSQIAAENLVGFGRRKSGRKVLRVKRVDVDPVKGYVMAFKDAMSASVVSEVQRLDRFFHIDFSVEF